jgi:predicted restriction endonuclease
MSLFEYESRFRELNLNQSLGHPSPHKVCMLLAVIDLVSTGSILENRIVLNSKLRAQFTRHFESLQEDRDQNNPHLPYFHLHTQCTSSDLVEPFDPISKRHFSAGDFSSLTC